LSLAYRAAPGLVDEGIWLRIRSDGTVLDTLRRPENLPNGPYATAMGSPGQDLMYLPYYPKPIWTWSPLGYLVTSRATTYALDVRLPPPATRTDAVRRGMAAAEWTESSPVLSIRRDLPPIEATSAERSHAREVVEQAMHTRHPDWKWDAPEIGTTEPMFDGVAIGRDGRIWARLPSGWPYGLPSPTLADVRRRAAAVQAETRAAGKSTRQPPGPEEPVEYDVFEPDGTYLGQVETPPHMSTFVRVGDLVYGLTYDADDVPYLTRFHIVWQ
jgi:hypothetical protein